MMSHALIPHPTQPLDFTAFEEIRRRYESIHLYQSANFKFPIVWPTESSAPLIVFPIRRQLTITPARMYPHTGMWGRFRWRLGQDFLELLERSLIPKPGPLCL